MPALAPSQRHRPRRTSGAVHVGAFVAAALAIPLALAACETRPTATPTVVPEATAAPTEAAIAGPTTPPLIPQPPIGDLTLHPDDARVDLEMPVFSNPTEITNPLFPVSSQASVLLLGTVDDLPFRTEVTLLPETRVIEWAGQRVEVAVSQYVAYLDGEIQEVAYDLYAQDDEGAVWYFGEDVFNFDAGAIVDTHGTWIAGRDGPAAMIMPASPAVGDVYRPENVPGLVFEEVVVKRVDKPLDGPFGAISGGLEIEELHMDGATEAKDFAPGYGEFYTEGDGDIEALALAVPFDATLSGVPADLAALETGARTAYAAAGARDWRGVEAAVADVRAAWDRYRSTGVPQLVEPIMAAAIDELAAATASRRSGDAQRAAIEVIRSTLDLELRHRPVVEVDRARFGLWLDELMLDAAAGDLQRVRADFFSLDYVRDRIAPSLDASGEGPTVNLGLEGLLDAIAERDFARAAEIARELGIMIAA